MTLLFTFWIIYNVSVVICMICMLLMPEVDKLSQWQLIAYICITLCPVVNLLFLIVRSFWYVFSNNP